MPGGTVLCRGQAGPYLSLGPESGVRGQNEAGELLGTAQEQWHGFVPAGLSVPRS